MNTKLTLNVNEGIIEQAKIYAKENQISLSKLIENYLSSLTAEKRPARSVTPLVESLTGVIPTGTSDNYKDEYAEYLIKKYS